MRYLGGKSRIAKRITEAMAELTPRVESVVEPFCGGGAMTYNLALRWPVIASDAFPGLAALHALRCQGRERLPIRGCTEAEFRDAKGRHDPASLAIRFALAFGGKYGAGIGRPTSKYARQYNAWCDKLASVGHKISWHERDYTACDADIRPGTLVYCDPPYAGTTDYKGLPAFDNVKFWGVAESWARRGAHVFVSELAAPEHWQCVWERPRAITLSPAHREKIVTERLFLLRA